MKLTIAKLHSVCTIAMVQETQLFYNPKPYLGISPVYFETTVVFTTKINLLNTTSSEHKSKLFRSHSNMKQGGRQNLISG